MGYQCLHSGGTVHHLHTRLQTLEIVELERDAPVQGDTVGRLLFTPLARSAPRIERYEIGDMGRWVPGPLCLRPPGAALRAAPGAWGTFRPVR